MFAIPGDGHLVGSPDEPLTRDVAHAMLGELQSSPATYATRESVIRAWERLLREQVLSQAGVERGCVKESDGYVVHQRLRSRMLPRR